MYFGEGLGSYKIALLFKLSLVLRHYQLHYIIVSVRFVNHFSLVCKSIHVAFFLCLATLTQIVGL